MIIDSAVITGSLTVSGSKVQTGDFNINGNLTVTGSLSVNGSNAVLSNQTSSFSTNNSLNSYTSSINAFSASILSYTSSLNSATSSFVRNNQTSSFVQNSQTSSFVQNSQTSSFVQNAQTGAFATFTAFNSYTSSNDTTNTTQNNRIAGLESYTSSINTATSSFVRNNQTSSMSVNSASFAATASFAGNFTVASTLTAQTLVVQTVSSSVVYSSGSNVFGNSLSNTQVLTGSVIITGSASVNGSNIVLTNQTASLASLNSYTSSNDTTNTTQNNRIAGLESYTSSLNSATSSFVRNSQTSSMSVLSAASASNITNAITNAADNRVLTANGGGTINGEANLTFNGSNLILAPGTAGITTGLYVNGGDITAARTSTSGVIYFGSSNSSVYLYYDGSNYSFGSAPSNVDFNNNFRGAAFYDIANTAFYLDPAASSVLSTAYFQGNLAAWNTTTPGAGGVVGGIHIGAASGTSNVGPALTFGARDASAGSNAQAGIFINSDGSYGTRMYIATTDSYAAGAKTAMSINETGIVTITRNYLQSNTDLRAPIFYDSANTSYYVDPASTSVVNIMSTSVTYLGNTSNHLLGANVWAGGGGYPGYSFTGGNSRFGFSSTSGVIDVYADGNFYATDNSYLVLHTGNYTSYTLQRKGNAGNANLNSSDYYNGTQAVGFDIATNRPGGSYGVMLNLQERPDTSGQLVIDYNTGDLYTRGVYTPTPTFSAWRTMLHSGNYTSYVTFDALSSKTSGTGTYTTSGDFRAPIFYDSDDTGRYLNPAGTSRFGTGNQYVLELFHTANNGDFNDALFVQNLTSGQRVQIGMSTTDTDGSHHRVTLRAYKGSGTYEGQFRIALRQASSASHTERLTLTAAGTLTVDGDLVAYSDARVKENIKTIENPLEKVLSLRGVSYTRTDMDDTSTKIGVIAQETQPIVPEVVHEQENGMLGVAYGNMAGLFIEAIKEQQKQIDELKQLVNKLLNN